MDDANVAVSALDGKELKGRNLKVDIARKRDRTSRNQDEEKEEKKVKKTVEEVVTPLHMIRSQSLWVILTISHWYVFMIYGL